MEHKIALNNKKRQALTLQGNVLLKDEVNYDNKYSSENCDDMCPFYWSYCWLRINEPPLNTVVL